MADKDKYEAAIVAALSLHNADGERWVGFPRADRLELYCTHCNKAAPCPTVQVIADVLNGR